MKSTPPPLPIPGDTPWKVEFLQECQCRLRNAIPPFSSPPTPVRDIPGRTSSRQEGQGSLEQETGVRGELEAGLWQDC